MPSSVYVATSRFGGDYRAAGKALSDRGVRASGWMLRDAMVYSFANLREEPHAILCEGDVEQHDTAQWADSDDLDDQHRFQDLLARTVLGSYPELRWHRERRHVHFAATFDLSPRKAGKGPGRPGRTVFGPHADKNAPENVGYYHHAALQMRFRRVDGVWYCQLEPDYCFTVDGVTEHRRADKLRSGIKRLEHHAAVSGWTRMWAIFLRGPADLLTSPKPIEFGDLLTVQVERGIDDRWWGPAPAAGGDELQEQAERDQAALTAELAAAGIDTEDLMSLLEDDAGTSGEVIGQRGGSPREAKVKAAGNAR